MLIYLHLFFFFQAEDGIRDGTVTGVQTCALPICLYRAALWVLLGANLLAGWGVQWDIQWHVRIGRDSFWIPPHVMTYTGVTLIVLASLGVLARDTLRQLRAGRAPSGIERVLGLSGTPGFLLASCGIALTVLAAPIDDLWHRLFGIDVTLWSPPHLLGLLGVTINTVGCFLIAREVYPAKSWARFVAVLVTGVLLFIGLQLTVQPSFRIAYLHGGVLFHFYSMLAALVLPLAYVTAARLSGSRWAPAVVLAGAVAVGLAGQQL